MSFPNLILVRRSSPIALARPERADWHRQLASIRSRDLRRLLVGLVFLVAGFASAGQTGQRQDFKSKVSAEDFTRGFDAAPHVAAEEFTALLSKDDLLYCTSDHIGIMTQGSDGTAYKATLNDLGNRAILKHASLVQNLRGTVYRTWFDGMKPESGFSGIVTITSRQQILYLNMYIPAGTKPTKVHIAFYNRNGRGEFTVDFKGLVGFNR